MSVADMFRQLSILIGLPAVLLAGGAAALVVIARDWRVVLFSYASFSIMLSLLLSQVIPPEWALQQAVVGGIVAVILFLSARQLRSPREMWSEARWPRLASLTLFRLLAVSLAAVSFLALRDQVQLPLLDSLFRDALVWLTLVGVLGLALHEEPLHAGLSLLIFLGGSELLLFTLTQRRMLVGIVQGGQILLGLAIAYLVLARGLTAAPPAALLDASASLGARASQATRGPV
jgi:uncharacterized MnhB-related membrane protein